MIVITTEYLDKNWEFLVANSKLRTMFSEWDDGDAHTLAEIGVQPSNIIIEGCVVLDNDQEEDYPIIINIKEESDSENKNVYLSPDGNKYNVSATCKRDGVKSDVEVYIESIEENIAQRRRGILETNLLTDKVVLIIGLGTGGIVVAEELAKAGVGNFIFIDNDRLEVGNVARHSAGISFVGRRKVAAARYLVQEIDPSIIIETHTVMASYESKSLVQEAIKKSHLVICATDNRPSKLFINALCVENHKTVIFGGAFRRAYGGQVFRVRPLQSACYHCFVMSMPDDEADSEISSQENADSIAYSDVAVPIEPGLSMDVAPISLMVAKLALQELIKEKESTLHILDKDFEVSWYIWINRPEPHTQYSDLPPLSESRDEMTILRWYGIDLLKDDYCPTCGDFEKGLREENNIQSSSESLPTLPNDME